MPELAEQTAERAVRLLFARDGDDLSLVSQTVVDVAVPALDTSVSPAPGHYLEVRDGENTSLGRIRLSEPFTRTIEVFPETAGEPITRVDQAGQGAFSVLVAAPPPARNVALVRLSSTSAGPSVPGTTAQLVPAAPDVTEIATFALDTNR